MNTFNGNVELPDDTVMTLAELIQAAIAARNYPTVAQRNAAVNRFGFGILSGESSVRSDDGDFYMMDAHAGVLNGKVSNHDGVTLTGADFTAVPGGGELIRAGAAKNLQNVSPGNRVLYQDTGGDLTLYLDISDSVPGAA